MRALVKNLQTEAPKWATLLPQLPRLLHARLSDPQMPIQDARIDALMRSQRNLLGLSLLALAVALGSLGWIALS